MESFRNCKESTDTILDRLEAKDYLIGNNEINDVIDELYALVDVNENYIDEAIMAIERLCDNNPMFKAEWEGALDEAEDEVLEESKLGKLASIALLAISMGITLTGCEASPDIQQRIPPVETLDGIGGTVSPEKNDTKEEMEVNEQKPTYEELMPNMEFRGKYSDGHYEEIKLTDEDKNKVVLYMQKWKVPKLIDDFKSQLISDSFGVIGTPLPTAIEYKIGEDGEWTKFADYYSYYFPYRVDDII